MAAREPPESSRNCFAAVFAEFSGILWNWWIFGDLKENGGIFMTFRFLGVAAAQTLILSKEYKGFVKGCGIQKISEFHKIL